MNIYGEAMVVGSGNFFKSGLKQLQKTNLNRHCARKRAQRALVRGAWVSTKWVPGNNMDCTGVAVRISNANLIGQNSLRFHLVV